MRDVPLAGWLLVRIDSFFVKRDDMRASASAARQILKAARGGRALGFFPEGTFQDYTGIHPFRRGAFAAAKAGKLPVVPVALSGTRDILRCYRWWPRIGRIRIKMLPPNTTEEEDQLRAGQLADEIGDARLDGRVIAAALGFLFRGRPGLVRLDADRWVERLALLAVAGHSCS